MSGTARLAVIGGGTGFIGTAIKNVLKSKGYNIITISRSGKNSMTWNDLSKKGLPDGTSAVVNVAGQNILDPTRMWTEGFKQNVYASRVNTTRYLAEAIQKSSKKPEVFISTSGVGYYKPSEIEKYDEESSGGNFDFLSRLCNDWEKSTDLAQESNVRTVIIRSGVVIGKQGGMISQLYWPFYFGLGGPVGSGKQYLPWIHISDIAKLFVFCIENNVSGVVNGVAPQIITNKEFARAFGRSLNRPSFLPLPNFVANAIFSKERAMVMTEGQAVVNKKAKEIGFRYSYPDIESACLECVK